MKASSGQAWVLKELCLRGWSLCIRFMGKQWRICTKGLLHILISKVSACVQYTEMSLSVNIFSCSSQLKAVSQCSWAMWANTRTERSNLYYWTLSFVVTEEEGQPSSSTPSQIICASLHSSTPSQENILVSLAFFLSPIHSINSSFLSMWICQGKFTYWVSFYPFIFHNSVFSLGKILMSDARGSSKPVWNLIWVSG